MMYACSCSLAAVSLITADANEMLTAYGDRESSRTLHQSTIYLRGGRARRGGEGAVGWSAVEFLLALRTPASPLLAGLG